MANQAIFSLFKEKFGWMLLIGALFAALGFLSLMLLQPRYQTSSDFLVVQTNTGNQDFYSQFKSAEYLGKVLGESIYSERFINAVIESGKVNADMLPFDKKDRLDTWRDMVEVRKNLELGVIEVTVKGQYERDTARIMDGIGEVLINKNMLFRSGDEKSVEVRILSGPIAERTPTVPMILKTVVASFAFGFVLTFLFVILKSQKNLGLKSEAELF